MTITQAEAQSLADTFNAGVTCTIADGVVSITRGRFACSFGLVDADGVARSRAELEQLVRDQVANVIRECARKPRTAEDIAEEQRKIAADARAKRNAAIAARHKALPKADRARVEYLAQHGEPDYADVAALNGDPLEALALAKKIGAVSDEQHALETARLEAWKRRCEARKK